MKNIKRYEEVIKELIIIKEKGFIKTHRSGNTGIGKTLEDLLGVVENNIQGPNSHETAMLKSFIFSNVSFIC